MDFYVNFRHTCSRGKQNKLRTVNCEPKTWFQRRKKRVRIVIRGVENIDPLRPEQAISESIDKTRMRQHKIRVPEVAEAIKGN